MTSEAPLLPLKLRPRAWTAILLLVTSGVFVATGLWLGFTGKTPGFLVAAFFGIGVGVAIVQLMPESTWLHITEEGLTYRQLFKEHHVPWEAVEVFYPVTMRQSGLPIRKMVGFDFRPSYDRSRLGRRVASMVAGCEAALPSNYGMKCRALVDLLNEHLVRTRVAQEETGEFDSSLTGPG
ncbi:MAG: hypothetical protein RL885_07105 [Planctomycetota bacterium]